MGLQFHFPSKWGTRDGTELLVQKYDLSKLRVHLTPSHLPHVGFDGAQAKGWGTEGPGQPGTLLWIEEGPGPQGEPW